MTTATTPAASNDTLPQLALDQLEPDRSGDLTGATLLGFTAQSWIDAHRALGPVFRIPEFDMVVLAGKEASRAAWRSPQDWSYALTDLGKAFRSQLGEGYITGSDGDTHWEQRRVLQPMFNGENIQRHAQVVADIVREELARHAGNPVELHELLVFSFTRTLNNSMVKTGADDAQIRDCARFEEEFIRGATSPDAQAWYARPAYRDLRERVFAFFRALVEARLSGERAGDNLDLLIDAMRARRERLDVEELVRDAYLMQAGGAGNIASLFCSLLWALLQRPDWLERVRGELQQFDPASLAATGMNGLSATRAAVLETERRFPPTPGMPKQALRDVHIDERLIPAGSNVFHLFTLDHYLEEDYPRAMEFRPERWLEDKPPRPNAFGGGRHMCIGMNLAYLNLLVGLKTLLDAWEVHARTGPQLRPIDPDNPDSPGVMALETTLQPR